MRSLFAATVMIVALAGCSKPPGIPGPCPAEFPELPIDPTLIADAGPDFEAETGDKVTFDGSASVAADGGNFTYFWGQTLGPCAELDLEDPARPVAKVPRVQEGENVLIYRLHLLRDDKMSAGDEAEIVVAAG